MQDKPVNPQYTSSPRYRESRKQWAFFGRVWSEEQTSLFLFGIPVIRKEKSPQQDRLRLLGIPAIKIQYDQFEKKTFVLGILVASRPNYRYLEQRITDSVYRLRLLSGAPVTVQSSKSTKLTLPEAREMIHKLPSYQLMCDTRDGRLLLEDELKIVTKQMEKLLAAEDRIDA